VISLNEKPLQLRDATAHDLEAITTLLNDAKLGAEELSAHIDNFIAAEIDGKVVGTIGMELYGEECLLRSAVVDAAFRGIGIGGILLSALIARARVRGIRKITLLTTTAEEYFAARGFTRVAREVIRGPILRSAQFRYACPSSATVMQQIL
jgi:amino-acid N-acetyltransferase